MSWRRIVLPTLALTLALILIPTLGIVHSIQILPPTGSLNKVSQSPIGLIPPAYGPCKKCRDLILSIHLSQGYSWAYGKDGQWYAPSSVHGQDVEIVVGTRSENIFFDKCYREHFRLHKCREWYDEQLMFRDVAGSPIYVYYTTLSNIYTKVTSSGNIAYINYLSVDKYNWRVRLYIINSRFYWASAVVGSRTVRLRGGGGSPPTLTKTVSGVGLSPIITRISWDNWLYYRTPAYATANASITYYYTLVLGLLARAYWLNGTPVDLPGLGIIDGYVPTKYWRVLRVYPGSAFSRNEPIVLHDDYMYYIYYVIPNKVFHVVVSKEFAIVLSNASSCLSDTWCPVANKRCGVVVLYCHAKRSLYSCSFNRTLFT